MRVKITAILFILVGTLLILPGKSMAKLNMNSTVGVIKEVVDKNDKVQDISKTISTVTIENSSKILTAEEKDTQSDNLQIKQSIHITKKQVNVKEKGLKTPKQSNEKINNEVKISTSKPLFKTVKNKTKDVRKHGTKSEKRSKTVQAFQSINERQLKEKRQDEEGVVRPIPVKQSSKHKELERILTTKGKPTTVNFNGPTSLSITAPFTIKAIDIQEEVLLQIHEANFYLVMKKIKSQWINAPPHEPPRYAFNFIHLI